MKPTSSSKSKAKHSRPQQTVVPRDSDLDIAESSRCEVMPSPDTVNIRDEDCPSERNPLPVESPTAKALHQRPPQSPDQLEAGSAGDAARPSRTGIVNPTLPPRSSRL